MIDKTTVINNKSDADRIDMYDNYSVNVNDINK